MLDDEVLAVVLAIVVVASVFAFSQIVLSDRIVDPFAALGLLGTEMRIGDYPSAIVVNESFRLYLFVVNHEGRTMYYVIYAKLGNKSTVINESVPADVPVLAAYEVVLPSGGNLTIPVELSVSEPGTNVRLIFELWFINESTLQPQYHGRWVQLWLNVTAPPSP
jgi:uncharacterized membrane protein